MTDIIKQQVFTSDLRVGMYVSSLDRPWLETPFMFQGFIISAQDEVEMLQHYCKYVYCDFSKGLPPLTFRQHASRNAITVNQLSGVAQNNSSLHRGLPYGNKVKAEQELPRSEAAYQDMQNIVSSVIEDVQTGKSMQLPIIRDAIQPMIDSILRNSDAFSWLIAMKKNDAYTYTHSLNCSALAINVGKQLGFPPSDLQDLATGALLFDVGKLKIPDELLNKAGRLDKNEIKIIRSHVDHSVEITRNITGVSINIIDMAQFHHERHNGSGYPYGLEGEHIPIFARIAALVDCFDAITTLRPYSDSVSTYHAALKLYEWRDIDFQSELVEQFIQAIGIYPTGSLVELSSGEVGIVLTQNKTRRLRPRVMVVLDKDKEPLTQYPIVDLFVESNDMNGKPLAIKNVLETGSYGIDPSEFYI